MGLFKRNLPLSETSVPPESTLGSGDVIPADNLGNRLRANGNLALNRATDVYRKNPKMVGGLALLAGALLLNRMKSR